MGKEIKFPVLFVIRDKMNNEKDKIFIQKLAYGEVGKGYSLKENVLINSKSRETVDLSETCVDSLLERLNAVIKFSKTNDGTSKKAQVFDLKSSIECSLKNSNGDIPTSKKVYFYITLGLLLKLFTLNDIDVSKGSINGINNVKGEVSLKRWFDCNDFSIFKFNKIHVPDSWIKYISKTTS